MSYSNTTGNDRGSDVRRGIHMKMGIAATLLILTLAPCMFPSAAHAQEPQAAGQESAAAWGDLRSWGSLVYQDGERQAEVLAEDFILLHKKLSTIPEETFEPIRYTHTHQWEYRNVNERTHTRHCSICGDAFDLEYVHSVSHEEDHTIRHEGAEYPGRRYSCVCGWQWEQEASHVIVFEAMDGTNHRSKCLLGDTAFCRGLEPITEEHYAYRYEPCGDGTHHIKICIDCGYEDGTETCDFTLKVNPEEEDARDPALLYCLCGNGKAVENGEDQTQEQPEESAAEPSGEDAEADEPGEMSGEKTDTDDEPGETSGEESGADEPDESSGEESGADKPGETSKEETEADEPEKPPEEELTKVPPEEESAEEPFGEEPGAATPSTFGEEPFGKKAGTDMPGGSAGIAAGTRAEANSKKSSKSQTETGLCVKSPNARHRKISMRMLTIQFRR